MDSNELLRKVRKIEIRTKALSHQIFAGEYHSAFKGRGMAFSEVREYQYGDDVRSMDWNVTARLRAPYVKVYEEERELTVMLLVDVSGSRLFGTQARTKRELMAYTKTAAAMFAATLRVNAVAPGFIETDMTEELDHDELVKTIPAGRFGTPDEVAHLVSFLASPNAGYITGQAITINGGLY